MKPLCVPLVNFDRAHRADLLGTCTSACVHHGLDSPDNMIRDQRTRLWVTTCLCREWRTFKDAALTRWAALT